MPNVARYRLATFPPEGEPRQEIGLLSETTESLRIFPERILHPSAAARPSHRRNEASPSGATDRVPEPVTVVLVD